MIKPAIHLVDLCKSTLSLAWFYLVFCNSTEAWAWAEEKTSKSGGDSKVCRMLRILDWDLLFCVAVKLTDRLADAHRTFLAWCEPSRTFELYRFANMKNLSIKIQTVIFLLILCLTGCKNNESAEPASSDADKFSFGKVISVSKTGLQVKEYDFSKDADVETAYVVTPKTEFGNITNLADLKPDDDVIIDYLEIGPKKVVTNLLKEENGGYKGPYPGHLIIAPDFQQIGDTEDGGGIVRAMADTMSMLSTNPAEQERLADLAHQAITQPRPKFETVHLSGINEWLASTSDLPDAIHLRQRSAFAPWKFMMWGDYSGECTVALYLANELQFAWQGFGMATTGPMLPEAQGEAPDSRFLGPPAGTDLDGDGVPDLLILDYSGGAHCCSTVKHIVCSDPPVLTAQISGWHSKPSYRDLDGDGRYEMIIGDASYAYWNACYAASPKPQVFFRIRHGHYEIAGDLMRNNAPSAVSIEIDVAELQHQLSRYDSFVIRRNSQTNDNAEVKLTPEEQADDDFFIGQAWREDGVCIPSPVWELLLNLIYSGQINATVKALDTMWPPGKAHKAEFANDLLAMIRGSWYGSHLPWFKELESIFSKHYPPPTQ